MEELSQNLSISEKIAYSTVKLTCELENGYSEGTGYIMQFKFNKENNSYKAVVITNKHVIANSKKITMFLNICKDGKPIDNEKRGISLSSEVYSDYIKTHPSEDLCAIDITQLLLLWKNNYNTDLFIIPISLDTIPKQEQLEELKRIEDVIMVGYPVGLIDEYNNKPIFRKGITATQPKLNYNNKREFLVDIACFHGSSGSPVFILNEDSYSDKFGNVTIGRRVYLLGTIYGNIAEKTHGDIKNVDNPTSASQIAQTNIPINIGTVIKSEALFELENMFK